MKYDLSRLAYYSAPARIGLFVGVLLVLWLPIAVPLYLFIPDLNARGILSLLALYTIFLALVRLWGRYVYRQPTLLKRYGLVFSRQNGWLVLLGLTIGSGSALVLFAVQAGLGWLVWQPISPALVRIVLEGLLVSLALGFAEELLFRGWLLDELERDYTPLFALLLNAVIFAALHFRLIVFPALMVLGVTLVLAKRTFRGPQSYLLGFPLGVHAGLVWGNYIVEVGRLVSYTNRVPEWVTGIGRNPLAGAIGILFLSGLALAMAQLARKPELLRIKH